MQTISNMTPNQLTLLRKVAARMPEVLIEINGMICWNDGSFDRVTERELLHVAAEFEKTLSNGGPYTDKNGNRWHSQRTEYAVRLMCSAADIDFDSWNWPRLGPDADWIFDTSTAPFETRAQAWLKVKP